MNSQKLFRAVLLNAIWLATGADGALAQGTAFTYQGFLTSQGAPANGSNDLTFTLMDAATLGSTVGASNVVNDLLITNGLFTVTLDFGAAFNGGARWLEIALRPGTSAGAYTNLVPRQPITATPYAITAGNLSGALPGASLSGTYANAVTLNNAANSFSGNGANLTALNASQLASGTVPAAVLGNAWKIGGNAGTTPGTQFLGTTDNQALELKVNGVRGFSLQPGTVSPNVVGGGFSSVAAGLNAVTIGGGQENTVSSSTSTIGGGFRNAIGSGGQDSTIGGGQVNGISNNTAAATVSGGTLNSIGSGSDNAAIGGGRFNRISGGGAQSTIGGGRNNFIAVNSTAGTISGGTNNLIGTNSAGATVSGGHNNAATGFLAPTVAGGEYNRSSEYGATVGGGVNNLSSGIFATVPGGLGNQALGYNSFAAGDQARALHDGCFVWSDVDELAPFAQSTADNQFVIRAAGGIQVWTNTSLHFGARTRQMLNLFDADYGVGVQLETTYFRTRGNGLFSPAGNFTWFAGGQHTNSTFDPGPPSPTGSLFEAPREMMRLAGDGQLTVFGTTANGVQGNTASAGSSGVYGQNLSGGGFGVAGRTTGSGYAIYGDNADASGWAGNFNGRVSVSGNQHFGSQTRQMLNLWSTQYGIGVQSYTLYSRTDTGGGFAWFAGGTHNDAQNNAGGGTLLMRLDSGGSLFTAGAVNPPSDRNAKENFTSVSPREILDKVAALPITRWNYKADAATRHVGPMAQDFYAAFAIGTDDKHIATVDADGVALAAIQGLNQKLDETRAENAELKQRLDALEKLLNRLTVAKEGGGR